MMRTAVVGALLVVGLPLALLGGPRPGGPSASVTVDPALLAGEIPEPMLSAYLSAGEAWGVDWALLAAVGKVECDHGRAQLAGCNPPGAVNRAGARGPMQFLGDTWRYDAERFAVDVSGPPTPDGRGYATDGDGDGTADPGQPLDAVHAAARYLQVLGVDDDPWEAARAYNAGPASHRPLGAGYADRVVEIAATYRTVAGPAPIRGWALPFDRDGLTGRAADRRVEPMVLLARPHHSGRVAADVPLPVGTPLRALRDGTVLVARTAGACGTTLVLELAGTGGATATYCHLASLTVETGQQVRAGQVIGASGGMPGAPGAGSSTGPHLHLHITTDTGRRCPQRLLSALWRNAPPPDVAELPTSGCTYAASAFAAPANGDRAAGVGS